MPARIHGFLARRLLASIYKSRLMKSKDGDFRYQEFYSDSLMLPDKEKYELFLLEMIKSDNLCTDQKRNCLISLNRVVTKQSIDFLESLLSDSELSERAA